MSAELTKDITNGFHKIDLERDEILLRHEQGWKLPPDPFIDHYKQRIEYVTYDYTEQLGLKFVDFGVKVNTIVNVDKLTPSELEELNQLF
ncbi:hypothetical protein [Paenibacillus sp. IHBB 3054]|uniref:hypothetical protein n=1 Tax=Paenibacillus sp. IHBB 3054 TaxID=3425689 RepID=UPI003F66D85A